MALTVATFEKPLHVLLEGKIQNAANSLLYHAPFPMATRGSLRHNESDKGFPLLGGTAYSLAKLGAVGKFLALTGESVNAFELKLLVSDLSLVEDDIIEELIQANCEKPFDFFLRQYEANKEVTPVNIDKVLENEIKDRVLDPQSPENPKKALAEVLYKQKAIEEANEQKSAER